MEMQRSVQDFVAGAPVVAGALMGIGAFAEVSPGRFLDSNYSALAMTAVRRVPQASLSYSLHSGDHLPSSHCLLHISQVKPASSKTLLLS